ncbi:hypothetical protein D9M68_386080 [compost metagenome]
MRNPFRRQPPSFTPGTLAYGGEEFFKLEQFRTGARIVKQVPVVRGEAAGCRKSSDFRDYNAARLISRAKVAAAL